ncbi:hypothetical protein PG996_004919 [Apiospora saccharicola]|uniref:Uncharacterized protein n=1 Tax=Apiospora saccharicola TaxID=335842 RepID=A0ABR1VMR6_9PEZI
MEARKEKPSSLRVTCSGIMGTPMVPAVAWVKRYLLPYQEAMPNGFLVVAASFSPQKVAEEIPLGADAPHDAESPAGNVDHVVVFVPLWVVDVVVHLPRLGVRAAEVGDVGTDGGLGLYGAGALAGIRRGANDGFGELGL